MTHFSSDQQELAARGLRPADEAEQGWYALLSDGRKVWATDAPQPAHILADDIATTIAADVAARAQRCQCANPNHNHGDCTFIGPVNAFNSYDRDELQLIEQDAREYETTRRLETCDCSEDDSASDAADRAGYLWLPPHARLDIASKPAQQEDTRVCFSSPACPFCAAPAHTRMCDPQRAAFDGIPQPLADLEAAQTENARLRACVAELVRVYDETDESTWATAAEVDAAWAAARALAQS